MQKRKRQTRLGRRILSALDLPEEAAGVPKLTLLGQEHILVENHGGIYQCGAEAIGLYTGAGMLWVEGSTLTIREISTERLLVAGRIQALRYGDGPAKMNKM